MLNNKDSPYFHHCRYHTVIKQKKEDKKKANVNIIKVKLININFIINTYDIKSFSNIINPIVRL